jgi:glycine dehydrogenase
MNTDEPIGTFAQRHIGPRPKDIQLMLTALGAQSLDSFIEDVLPPAITNNADLALPTAISEAEAIAKLNHKAQQNQVLTSLLGMGYYNTIIHPLPTRNKPRQTGSITQLPNNGL